MFTRILIPLDGSIQAENALWCGGIWAARAGARVELFHVLERNAPAHIHGEPHLQNRDEARAYLQSAADRCLPEDVLFETCVMANAGNNVPTAIAEHLRETGSDLLAISPHGLGNWRMILHGSIPERVACASLLPVLIAFGRFGESRLGQGELVVIPDDADSRHERGWSRCVELLRLFGANACLVGVVETEGSLSGPQQAVVTMQPAAVRELLELRKEQLRAHLEEHLARLRSQGIEADVALIHGNPPLAVCGLARERRAGLVILRTHSRAGLNARLAGGFAAEFLRDPPCAVLVLPIGPPASTAIR
jgi:nucleotide-binding universal stress UspA family protein